jgi:hypothetical protein
MEIFELFPQEQASIEDQLFRESQANLMNRVGQIQQQWDQLEFANSWDELYRDDAAEIQNRISNPEDICSWYRRKLIIQLLNLEQGVLSSASTETPIAYPAFLLCLAEGLITNLTDVTHLAAVAAQYTCSSAVQMVNFCNQITLVPIQYYQAQAQAILAQLAQTNPLKSPE